MYLLQYVQYFTSCKLIHKAWTPYFGTAHVNGILQIKEYTFIEIMQMD